MLHKLGIQGVKGPEKSAKVANNVLDDNKKGENKIKKEN